MTKIYVLKDPNSLQVRYVGKTVQLLRYRLSCHISRSKKHHTTHSNCWIFSLLKENKRPIIELIEEVEDNIWEEREIFWINYYKKITSLTNFQIGGGHSNIGKNLSKEHREAISKSLKGKPRDDETKKKISLSHKGKVLKESTKQKLREINLGKTITLETRKKMSKGGVEQYSSEGVLIKTYYSLQDASNQTGFFKGNISSACTGRLKTYKKYIWKYKS